MSNWNEQSITGSRLIADLRPPINLYSLQKHGADLSRKISHEATKQKKWHSEPRQLAWCSEMASAKGRPTKSAAFRSGDAEVEPSNPSSTTFIPDHAAGTFVTSFLPYNPLFERARVQQASVLQHIPCIPLMFGPYLSTDARIGRLAYTVSCTMEGIYVSLRVQRTATSIIFAPKKTALASRVRTQTGHLFILARL
jgi:hypothetical protein